MNIYKIEENQSYETYLIEGASVDELIDECLKRIRVKSKEYYKKELKLGLKLNGESFIDHHAGMGIGYKVRLI